MNPKEMHDQLSESLAGMQQQHQQLGEAILRQQGAIEACRLLMQHAEPPEAAPDEETPDSAPEPDEYNPDLHKQAVP